MKGISIGRTRWFDFTTRDLTIMAIMIVATGLFSILWVNLVFNMGVLGVFTSMFASFGFNFWGFAVLYFVPKSGAPTIVKFFAAWIEVLMGSPVGLFAVFYSVVEGLGIDLAYILFKRRLTLAMMITGSLIAWALAAPVDAYRDAVPLTLEGLGGYFGPGMVGKVFAGWLCWLALNALRTAGVRQTKDPLTVPLADVV